MAKKLINAVEKKVQTVPYLPQKKRLPKASDLLGNEIRAMILEQDLAPGAPLPSESELIDSHQYSRGTVREALRLLETEGYISVQRGPKGGITVRYPTVDLVSKSLATMLTIDLSPLSDLFEFRKLIEPAAAELAAKNATDGQIAQLLEISSRSVPERGSITFHNALSESTGNEMFRVILAAVNRVVEWQTSLESVPEREVMHAGDAHAAIAKAISQRQGTKASALMLQHIKSYEKVMAERGRLSEATLPRELWISQLRGSVHS